VILPGRLSKFVKKTKFDIIVVDLQASELSPTTLQDVVEPCQWCHCTPDEKESLDRPLTGPGKAIEKK